MMNLIQATNLPNIRNCEYSVLLSKILYAIKITALTKMPSDGDLYFLATKLKEFFGYLKPNEIQLAFDFAIQKKYNCEINHFQNFSVLYFSGVVNAYLDYRNKEAARLATQNTIKKNDLLIKIDIEKEQAQKEYDSTVVKLIFEKYKAYDVVIIDTTFPKMVYNSLFNYHKIIELSPEDKKKIWLECEAKHEKEKERIKTCRTDSLADYKKRKIFLSQIEKPEGRKEQILDLVYTHCVKIAFDAMIKKNINL